MSFTLKREALCPVAALLLASVCLLYPVQVQAQSSQDVNWNKLGVVKPRHATEITASNWSVGAETMDRDYTIYENWKEYLGPLGVKKARIQAGWAKVEQQEGIYHWDWLDEIIFDMPERGVEPWVNLSYGNPVYEGGGTTRLMGAAPTSEEALRGWERWVQGMVARYEEVVDEWEIWNEPNYEIDARDYTELLIRSAETIREIQPDAKILAMALGSGVDYVYADSVLQMVEAQGKLHLIDEVTFHRHRFDPENYEPVAKLRQVVEGYASHIEIRQGESGAPSEFRETRALSGYPWTELTQAKWNLRRLLGDLGRGIPSSLFGIVDMKYPDEINRKGLLRISDDKTVARPKQAYYAVQNLTSIFDHDLKHMPNYPYRAVTDSSLSVFGFENRNSGKKVVAAWLNNETPKEENQIFEVDFTFFEGGFEEPVYVDLREGDVYRVPAERWTCNGSMCEFQRVPVYDSPVLIADRSNVRIDEAPPR